MTNVTTYTTVQHLEPAVRPLELAPVAERHELPSVVCHTLFRGNLSSESVKYVEKYTSNPNPLGHCTQLFREKSAE